MKKTILFALGIPVVFSAYTQSPVITNENLPLANDSVVLNVDVNPMLDLGTYEPNQVWDFSGLNTNLVLYACYGDVNELDFAIDFPNSQIYTYGPSFLYGGMFGASPENYGYLLFATDNDGFKIKGYRSDFGYGMISVYNEPFEMILPTPFEYEDEYVSNSIFEIRFEEDPTNYDTIYKRSISKTITACAYGQLTTPYSTFSNVLNVKEVIIYTDTAFITFSGIAVYDSVVVRDTVIMYNFWSPDYRHPVAVVEVDSEGNQIEARYLSYELVSHNIYRDNSFDICIYPNPIIRGQNPAIKSSRSLDGIKASVVNIKGEVVSKQKINNNNIIKTDHLNSGIYKILFTNHDRTMKIVKSLIIIE